MDKLPPKVVSSLSKLPQYKTRSIDITHKLDFSGFALYEGEEELLDIYLRMAIGIGDLFYAQDLVEIESYVYSVKLYGRVIHHQINVLGRDPTNGQPYSAYLM